MSSKIKPQEVQTDAPDINAMVMDTRKAFSIALGKTLDADQFAIAGRMVYKTAGKWLLLAIHSDPRSFIDALMQAAQLQLSCDPQLGEFYIVPRKHRYPGGEYGWRAEGQIGYIGLMKRARRCPGVVSLDADVIREGDHFAYSKGSSPYLEHSISLDERGDFRGAYAIAHHESGPPVMVVINSQGVYDARSKSDAFNRNPPSGPWVTDFDAMAKKTPLRRLCKLLAVDDLTRAQLQREERIEAESVSVAKRSTIDIPSRSLKSPDAAAALLAGRELPAPLDREPGDDSEEGAP